MLGFDPRRDAQVAQLVEHATENRSVAGSIPALGTITSKDSTNSMRKARWGPNHRQKWGSFVLFSLAFG